MFSCRFGLIFTKSSIMKLDFFSVSIDFSFFTLLTWMKKRQAMVNSADAFAKRRALRDGIDTDGEMIDDQEEIVIEKLAKEEELVVDPATVMK